MMTKDELDMSTLFVDSILNQIDYLFDNVSTYTTYVGRHFSKETELKTLEWLYTVQEDLDHMRKGVALQKGIYIGADRELMEDLKESFK